MADKYHCAVCNGELEREELAGAKCPYCLTEIPEAAEDKLKEATIFDHRGAIGDGGDR